MENLFCNNCGSSNCSTTNNIVKEVVKSELSGQFEELVTPIQNDLIDTDTNLLAISRKINWLTLGKESVFYDLNQMPLGGGKVYTYLKGTLTPLVTYKDEALTIPNSNPIILDVNGKADIFLKGEYRLRVYDSIDRLSEDKDNITQLASKEITNAINTSLTTLNVELDKVKKDTGINVLPTKPGQVTRSQSSKNGDIVSLLDFGAPYTTDSTTQLQAAINTLANAGGGVLYIPYHVGTLVISNTISLKSNVTVLCDRNLVVDCTASLSGVQFRFYGGTSAEIPLGANKTTGDTTLSTTTAHGLSYGDDILLISQRECAHADAGPLWRLGETTANTASPFFAEPLEVGLVNSSTSFNVTTPIIFPDYRTDKTMETSAFARNSSTILKINAIKNSHWIGGIFKKEKGDLFRMLWCKDCSVDAQFERGYGTGIEGYILFSNSCKIKAKVNRPSNWILETDHSAYNSIKDVSSWYSDVELFERNGSQGVDQTYSLYCGIQGNYKVTHINSHEDGMTTHGCTYGCTVDITAINCAYAAFRNRARFAKGKVTAINCKWGMRNSTYGVLDSDFEVNLRDCFSQGVALLDEGVTASTPAIKNAKISGTIIMSSNSTGRAIEIEANNDLVNKYADSGILLKDLYIRSYYAAIKTDSYINGVTFDNVKIDHYGTTYPIWLRYGAGHRIRGLHVTMRNTDGTVPAIVGTTLPGGSADAVGYGSPSYVIDYKSCKVINGILINDDDRLISNKFTLNGTSSSNSIINITNNTVSDLIKVDITSGTGSENRIALDTKLAIGREFTVLVTASNPSTVSFGVYAVPNTTPILFLDGVNDGGGNFLNITGARQFRVRKVTETQFVVSR